MQCCQWRGTGTLALGACAALLISGAAEASTFTIVAQLSDYHNQGGVISSASADTSGNLYFAGIFGSTASAGAVYRLTAKSAYSRVDVLYTFNQAGANGSPVYPQGSVSITNHGDLLTTSYFGGTDGLGTILSLEKPYSISETTLHSFFSGQTTPTDGFDPGDLALGPSNKFFGATTYGGADTSPQSGNAYGGDGTLYLINPSTTNPTYKVLHRFGAAGDGINPTTVRLAVDSAGRVYGVTYGGGANGVGTVFMLQYVNDAWQEQVLYSFASAQLDDLDLPTANVVLDSAGNLYGCAEGGRHGQGGLFKLSPPAQAGGVWQEKTIYAFGHHQNDAVAAFPGSQGGIGYGCGITIDPSTNLIVGTSAMGGKFGYGTIFTLTPPSAGQTGWTETVGYSFADKLSTGYYPVAPPFELNGVYYGSTLEVAGAVYAFTP